MRWALAVYVVATLLAGCQAIPRAAESPRDPQVKPTTADYDGDGRLDEAHVGHQGTGVWLIVDLATGKQLKLLLTGLPTGGVDSPHACTGSVYCHLAGTPDFDRNGRHELAVQLDSGAYMGTIGLFRVDREAIRRIWLAGSDRPFALHDGASVRYGATYLCRQGAVVVDFAWGNDIDEQHRSAITGRAHRFDGERFVFLSQRERLEPKSAGYPPPLAGRPC